MVSLDGILLFDVGKGRNRRIDLRFLMDTPKSEALTNLLTGQQ